MLKKYSVLLGTLIALTLLLIATMVYPGGSFFDKHSVGFRWSENFISNLFAEEAMNGAPNQARFWADAGMIFLSASFTLFFIKFSKKIQIKSAASVIKYLGTACMFFTFLIVTPLHGYMVIIASTLFLVCIFYITVFVLKSKLHLLKFLCIICLLIFYTTLYLYGSGDYTLLPIMQKVTFTSNILFVLVLEYFTRKEDFEHIQAKQPTK